jgi:TrpR-related protein YerC/YecD
MKQTWKTKKLKNLSEALLTIPDTSTMLAFLRDILTLDELAEISNRWEAVRLLKVGKTYRDIAKTTGLSTTTVSRIAHWLRAGEGGYEEVYQLTKKKK